jgi:hypothetical protein
VPLECPACGVAADPADERAFRLYGTDGGRPVRRCCHCGAALIVERAANGTYDAHPLSPETWEAMKSAWRSWEAWTAIGWQEPNVIKDILACAGQEFTRLTPTERKFPAFHDLVDPAIAVVIAAAELGSEHPELQPLAQRLHPSRPLSDEVFREAESLLAQAIWILIARIAPDQWHDPQSHAHRRVPLDAAGRPWMERLALPQDALVGTRQLQPPVTEDYARFLSGSLEWFAGAEAASTPFLVQAWGRILGDAENLMWDAMEATQY